jgi:hypothetical protein
VDKQNALVRFVECSYNRRTAQVSLLQTRAPPAVLRTSYLLRCASSSPDGRGSEHKPRPQNRPPAAASILPPRTASPASTRVAAAAAAMRYSEQQELSRGLLILYENFATQEEEEHILKQAGWGRGKGTGKALGRQLLRRFRTDPKNLLLSLATSTDWSADGSLGSFRWWVGGRVVLSQVSEPSMHHTISTLSSRRGCDGESGGCTIAEMSLDLPRYEH